MKTNGSTIINIVIALFIFTAICIKYVESNNAYRKAELEKVEYCIRYHEQLERVECFIYEIQFKDSIINQMEKDYIEQWEENQVFSSMLGEVENEPGGYKILNKLWKLNKSK